MLNYIHPEDVFKLDIEIATRDRKIIGRIKHAYNRQLIFRLGQLNEFNFAVPYRIDKRGQSVRNKEVDKLKSGYHVKVTLNNESEWFIISNLNSQGVNNNILDVQLKSLGYQLASRKIRTWAGIYNTTLGEYSKDSLNAQQVLNDILLPTAWSVDYIDSEFITKYRSFDFSNTSRLDAIYMVAEKMGGIVQWDTERKSISLVKQENVGQNKGLRINYGRYLRSLNKEERSDEVVTRLHLFGQDNMSIHRVNPLGTSYVEDYSYYMTGFKRDSNKSTISSSIFMSDGLCHALLDHKEKVNSLKGDFENLISQQEAKEKTKNEIEIELATLDEQIKSKENIVDVKQSEGVDAGTELSELSTLRSQYSSKSSELSSIESQISSLESQANSLKQQIKIDSTLTADQIKELDNYIHEDVWEDANYIDDKELYEDGIKVFMDLNKPKIIVNIDIINLWTVLEEPARKDSEKLKIGDKFFVFYEEFNIEQESQLLELTIGFDDTSVNVTIANTEDFENDDEKLAKYLANSVSTGSTVDMSKYKWDSVNEVKTEVSEIINSVWDSAKREIVGGTNETVTINNRGLTITDSNDPMRFIRGTNSALMLTTDGGNTFKHGITPDGLVGESIFGKILIGEHLIMENSSGKFTFDGNGVVIDGASLTITGGLPKGQLDPEFADGLFEIDKDYTNGIRMDSANGIVVTRSDDKSRAYFNATDGFKFQTKVGTTWQNRFYYDANNNRLVLNGEGNFSELKVNGKSVLTSTKTQIDGDNIDSISTDQLTLGSAKISTAWIENLIVGKNVTMGANASISWEQVTDQPFIPQDPVDIGAVAADQKAVFNILTDYGAKKGLFMQNGELYVSADYIRGNRISGVTIDVDTNAYVGQNIYLQFEYENRFNKKGVIFYDGAAFGNSSATSAIWGTYLQTTVEGASVNLVSNESSVDINARTMLRVNTPANLNNGTNFKGTVDFTNATVVGLNASTTAKFG